MIFSRIESFSCFFLSISSSFSCNSSCRSFHFVILLIHALRIFSRLSQTMAGTFIGSFKASSACCSASRASFKPLENGFRSSTSSVTGDSISSSSLRKGFDYTSGENDRSTLPTTLEKELSEISNPVAKGSPLGSPNGFSSTFFSSFSFSRYSFFSGSSKQSGISSGRGRP